MIIRRLNRRFAPQSLAGESGFALVFAVICCTVLVAVATTVAVYGVSGNHHADLSKADQTAYTLAEAGLNDALAVLHNPANNAQSPTLLPDASSPRTDSFSTGRVVWWGSFDATSKAWTVTAVGHVPNPTAVGNADIVRRVSARVPVGVSFAERPNSPAWNYVLLTATSGGSFDPSNAATCDVNLQNSPRWYPPLWVMGNLCLDNSSAILDGPLVVRGWLDMKNPQSRIGSQSKPISEAHVVGGCSYHDGPLHQCVSGQDNIWATVLDSNPTPLTVPAADFTNWYEAATPGPRNGCQSSTGTPLVFDNNNARDNSAGIQNLTPSASYTCITDRGSISWDAASHTLSIAGTVYIDGSLIVDNGSVNQYNGQGTIYLTGTFQIAQQNLLCASVTSGDCNFAGWNPNTEMLVIVANGTGGQNNAGVSIQQNSGTHFQGAYYANGTFWAGQSSQWEGPVIARTISVQNSILAWDFPLITEAPSGMPGNPVVYANPNQPTYLG